MTRWTYNGFGELASNTTRYSDAVLYRNARTRDDLGRITAKTEMIQDVTTSHAFAYDSTGRLVEVTVGGHPIIPLWGYPVLRTSH